MLGPDPFVSLMAVSVAAFTVPLLLGLVPRSPVPAIVGEVLAGIALGSSWLGLIGGGEFIDFLFLFGLAFLLFLAGFEIDFQLLLRGSPGEKGAARRSPVVLGVANFVIRITVALVIAYALQAVGIVNAPVMVAVLLVSTSLGIVLSVLKNDELSHTSFGQAVLVVTAIADLGTVVLLSVLFSTEGRSAAAQLSLVGVMFVSALLLSAAIRFAGRAAHVSRTIERLSGSTSQIRVRGSLALLLVLVGLSAQLGLELILGAFMAGAVMSAASAPSEGRKRLTLKLEAVGYGFFVPVFFVLAGARIDLGGLLADREALALVPLLAVAALIVKVPAALVLRGLFGTRRAVAAGFLQSAQLTLTIAGVEIGEGLGLLEPATGSALILVALITVLLAPLLFHVVDRGGSSGPATRLDPAEGG